MKYKCRIIHKETKKPYTVASGVYEMPREEVFFNNHQQAQEFIKDRPSLTYELIFEKIEPEPFNPETACVFVERPAHTMKVGDIIRQEFDGECSIVEVVEIGEIENNVFIVFFNDLTRDYFAVNQAVLFLEEFDLRYEFTYKKTIPSFDLKSTEQISSTTWSPSKEIHDRRIKNLKDNKNWNISDLKESVYLMKKISERIIDE